MTKSLECRVVVSEEVCKTAGVATDVLTRQHVEIRGRVEAMTVFTATDPTVLASLVDPPHVEERTEPESQSHEPEQRGARLGSDCRRFCARGALDRHPTCRSSGFGVGPLHAKSRQWPHRVRYRRLLGVPRCPQ